MRRALARALLAVVPLLAAPIAAQSPLDDSSGALEAARTRLESLADPQDADKAWHDAIVERIALLEELRRTRQQQDEILSADVIAARRSRAEDAQDAEQKNAAPDEVRLSSADEVTGYQDAARAAQSVRDQRRRENDQLKTRREAIQQEQRALPERAGTLQPRLDQKPDDDDELGLYQLQNAEVEQRVVEERTAYLADISQALMSLAPVVRLELDTASAAHARVGRALELARAAAARLRDEAAARARERADAAAREAEQAADPVERFRRQIQAETARRRAKISEEKNRLDRLAGWISVETEGVERVGRERTRSLDDADAIRNTLDRALDHRDRLDRIERLHQQENVEVRRELSRVLDRIWNLQLPEVENDDLKKLLGEVPTDDHARARAVFAEVISRRDGLVPVLRQEESVLKEAELRTTELEALAEQHDESLHALIASLQKQLLWQRQDALFSAAALKSAGEEVSRFAELSRAEETLAAVDAMLQRQPFSLIGAILLVALSFFLGRGFRRIMRGAAQASEPGVRVWGPGLAAILLWAAPIPVALILLSVVTGAPDEPELVALSVSHFLWLQGWLLLARRVAIVVLSPGGIVVRTGASLPDVAAHGLRSIRVLTLGAQLLWAPAVVLAESPLVFDAIPRILSVAWFGWALYGVEQMLSWRQPIYQRWSVVSPALRGILRVLAPAMLVALAGAIAVALVGYGAVADLIAFRSLICAFTAVGLAWLYVAIVRLGENAARRLQERTSPGADDEALSVSSLAARTALPRAAAFLVIALAAFFVYRFVGLGTILFEEMSEVVFYESDDSLTLLDVFFAVIWIAVGHIASSHVGRVYDTVSSAAGDVNRGSLFATVTLARYAIVLVGYSAALLAIGLEPENLAWLLTAVSVGLGFGLQEIVANFISGLILLFEQPIRIGDTITVGDTGGTVEKITIRSTVVTNWERQTIIIPNKNFITENLTNWTRNDRIMRRVLQIKVEYGSEIERILKILDEVVGQHPAVLEKPPHRLFVQGFGEYSLDFEVWFYTDIDVGLRTKTELYRAIYERFEREGIVIPVPIRRTKAT